MENKIKEILDELYSIDSSLKEKEDELEKIILKMLEIKPNIKIDEEFKNKLNSELNSKITEIKIKNYNKNSSLSFTQIFAYIFWTIWMACFWFIIFRDNILNTLTPISWNKVVYENINNKKEEFSKQLKRFKKEESRENIIENIPKESVKEINTIQNDENISQKAKTESIVPEAPKVEKTITTNEVNKLPNDTINSTESVWLMMDQSAPSWWISNLKASPGMNEYIQEVYHFSFSWEINIDLNWDFPTFKKDSSNNMYFSKQDLELEKSNENILKVALKWWKDWFIEMPESQKKKDIYINLKNPKLWYTNVYTYSNWESKEYFVPAIIFEVDKTWEANNYYQNEVIVPLVKEIYKYDENWTIIWVSQ